MFFRDTSDNAKMIFLCATVFALLSLTSASPGVTVDTQNVINQVEARYLSYTLDSYLLSTIPKFNIFPFNSSRLRTLMRGLSPAYLRFGGTSADYSVFTEISPSKLEHTGTQPKQAAMSQQDWNSFMNLTRSTGTRFLYQLNLQLRYGEQWDPSNAMALFEYLTSQGYAADVDFELGNEPALFQNEHGFSVFTGEKIAQDYVLLKNILAKYPLFNATRVVGPSSVMIYNTDIYKDFISYSAQLLPGFLTAFAWHQYYLDGKKATPEDYLTLMYFDKLSGLIKRVQSAIDASANPNLPIWYSETSTGYGGGTPGVSDRFVAGFLWMDKLGVSATMGVKVVCRQSIIGVHYSLLAQGVEPNPDYWLSYAYKQLVGEKVLSVTLDSSVPDYARIYAHCTKPSTRYPKGAVTIYAMNINQTASVQLTLGGGLAGQQIDQYLFSAEGSDGILSSSVNMNNVKMALVNDNTLPELTPVTLAAGSDITMPAVTYGFFVLPSAQATACTG